MLASKENTLNEAALTTLRAADGDGVHARFARTALSLYRGGGEFEIPIPEGYDEVEVAAAFRAEGCEITYITPRHTVIVVPRGRGPR